MDAQNREQLSEVIRRVRRLLRLLLGLLLGLEQRLVALHTMAHRHLPRRVRLTLPFLVGVGRLYQLQAGVSFDLVL